MDLSSLVIPDAAKRAVPIVTCVIEGILDHEDLRMLAVGEHSPEVIAAAAADIDDPSDLKKLREKHHAVARLVAAGMTQRLTAAITGYTESYISILLNAPAVQELVEMYRIQNGAATQVITEKLKTVGLKALERLDSRIEADGLNNQELLAAAKLGMDRSGHGPQSTRHVHEERHLIDHAEIAKLDQEARRGSRPYIISPQEARRRLPAPSVGDAGEGPAASGVGNTAGGDEHSGTAEAAE